MRRHRAPARASPQALLRGPAGRRCWPALEQRPQARLRPRPREQLQRVYPLCSPWPWRGQRRRAEGRGAALGEHRRHTRPRVLARASTWAKRMRTCPRLLELHSLQGPGVWPVCAGTQWRNAQAACSVVDRGFRTLSSLDPSAWQEVLRSLSRICQITREDETLTDSRQQVFKGSPWPPSQRCYRTSKKYQGPKLAIPGKDRTTSKIRTKDWPA